MVYYISLKSNGNITYSLNEDTLSLSILYYINKSAFSLNSSILIPSDYSDYSLFSVNIFSINYVFV